MAEHNTFDPFKLCPKNSNMSKAIILFQVILLINVFKSWSQSQYNYDHNGNMLSDPNKGISSIQYNWSNLPDTVEFIDGRKIYYQYTASGTKLAEQVIGHEEKPLDRKSTRLNSSHTRTSRMPSSA